jgi:predicted phosphodiesterase
MPTTALLYDIHGNLPALEAVLSDARDHGVDTYVLGGDYALFGAWPKETLDALTELERATWIRGNVDRWTALIDVPDDDGLKRAIEDCRGAIGEDVAAFLGALPEQTAVDGTRYCHASPANDMQSFLPDAQPDEEDLLRGVSERRVVFGHTHLQFNRLSAGDVELINPGSVGLPLDGDQRAAYALLSDRGELQLRRVAYDYEASARAVVEHFGHPEWAGRSARRLREARP